MTDLRFEKKILEVITNNMIIIEYNGSKNEEIIDENVVKIEHQLLFAFYLIDLNSNILIITSRTYYSNIFLSLPFFHNCLEERIMVKMIFKLNKYLSNFPK